MSMQDFRPTASCKLGRVAEDLLAHLGASQTLGAAKMLFLNHAPQKKEPHLQGVSGNQVQALGCEGQDP